MLPAFPKLKPEVAAALLLPPPPNENFGFVPSCADGTLLVERDADVSLVPDVLLPNTLGAFVDTGGPDEFPPPVELVTFAPPKPNPD